MQTNLISRRNISWMGLVLALVMTVMIGLPVQPVQADAPVPYEVPSVGDEVTANEQPDDLLPESGIMEAYGQVPLHFEPNNGQVDAAEVAFVSRTPGMTVFFTQVGVTMALNEQSIKMNLVAANPDLEITGQDEMAGRSNYFSGNNPDNWHTDVPNYSKAHYAGVWAGIDATFYGNMRQLEYDFIVAPGADPSQIVMAFEGVTCDQPDANGDLACGAVVVKAPVIYQEIAGERVSVDGQFVVSENHVSFSLGTYDPAFSLVIDPLIYSTYLGGSGGEYDGNIFVDTEGNAYVVGESESPNFPTTAGAYQTYRGNGYGDIVITKLNATGTALIYSTYFGGMQQGQSQSPANMTVDAAGNVYVVGDTTCDDFPTTFGAFNRVYQGTTTYGDGFLTKLNATGNALVYSTYLGGALADFAQGVAVDSSGNAYVAGYTKSTDFPTTSSALSTVLNGTQDGFVVKFNAAGSALIYGTFLGGSSTDRGFDVAIDGSGNAYVTGDTSSTDFPITSGAYDESHNGSTDMFVAKLNATGSALSYATFLGGSGSDSAYAIAVDNSGNASIGGKTYSTDFPTTALAWQTTHGGSSDGMVATLNADGDALLYATYLCGTGFEYVEDIALGEDGSLYVTGRTTSDTFPITADAYQPVRNLGAYDAFVTHIDRNDSANNYSTFFGGSESEIGYGIAVDSIGHIYVVGQVEESVDFPTTDGAFQTTAGGGTGELFVTKLSPFYPPDVTIDGTGLAATQGATAWQIPSSSISVTFSITDNTDSGLASVSSDYSHSISEWPTEINQHFDSGDNFSSDGYYQFDVTAEDNKAGETSVTRYLKIDASGPNVTLTGTGLAATEGAAAWQDGSRTVTFSVSDPMAGIASQSAKYSWAAGAFPTASATDFTSGDEFTTDGYYRFEVIATDNAGNNTTVVRYLKIDASDPEVTLTGAGLAETAGETTWQDGNRTVTFSVSDAPAGIASQSAKYTRAASAFPTTSATDFTSGDEFTADGYYRFEVIATDNAGNSTTVMRYLKIDASDPDVTVTGTGLAATEGTSSWQDGSRTATFSVSDAPAGIASQSAKYRRMDESFPPTSDTAFTSGAAFSTDGYYRFEVIATDNVGNSTTVIRYLKIDTVDPVVTVTGTGLAATTGAAAWQDGSRTVAYSAGDSLAGIASQSAKYTRAAGAFPTTSTTDFSSEDSFSEDGYYRFEVTATDNAGNSTTVVRYLKIDASDPEVTLTGTGLAETAGETTWQDDSRIVTFSMSDSTSNIASQTTKYTRSTSAFPTTSTSTFNNGDVFALDGYYRFEVTATDNAGNSTTVIRYLKIDTVDPVVTVTGTGLTSTSSAATWQDGSRSVTFSVSDSLADIGSQSAKYTRATDAFPTTSTTDFSSGDVFSLDGHYRFEVTATDNAGNSTTVIRYLKIDASAPDVEVTSVGLAPNTGEASWQDGSRTVTFLATATGPSTITTTSAYGYQPSSWPTSTDTTFTSGREFTANGYYKLVVQSINEAGVTTTVTRYFKIDAAAPVVTVSGTGLAATEGAAAWQDGSRSVTFSVSDALSGIASQSAKYSWAAGAFPTASATTFTSGTGFSTDGYYRFEVSATDNAGNNTAAVRYLKIDGSDPVVTVTGAGLASTTGTTTWQDGSRTVTFSVSDAPAGIASQSAKYTRAASAFPTTSATDFTSGDEFTADGYYRFEVSATDNAGNSTTVVRYLKIDASDPVVTATGTGLAEIAGEATWQDGSRTITFSVSDSPAGIDGQTAKYSRAAGSFPTSSITTFTNGAEFSTDGYYRFELTATDNAGNSTTVVRYLKIDASDPDVTVTGTGLAATEGAAAWQDGNRSVTFSVSDSPAGIASQSAKYTWDASAFPTASTTDFTSGTGFSTDGYYRLEVTATDNAGNSTTVVRYLKIDASDPVVTATGAGLASTTGTTTWQDGSRTVTFSVSDAPAGIASQSAKYTRSTSAFPTTSATNFTSGDEFTDDGYYRFEVIATDNAGNSTTVVRYLKIDATAPTVTVTGTGLTSTSSAATWQDGSRSVTFSVSDPMAGIASQSAKYTRATDAFPTTSTTDFSSGDVFSLDGHYRFEVSATDSAGNSTTVVRYLKIDASAPDVEVTSVGLAPNTGEASWQDGSRTVTFLATATGPSTITTTSAYGYKTSSWPTSTDTTFTSGREFTANGYYKLVVQSINEAGVTTTVTRYFKIDAAAPVVTVSGTGLAATEGAAAWQDGSRSVTFSVSDALSGIDSQSTKYTWAADAFPTTSDTTFTSGTGFSDDGYYRFEVIATDNAGNNTTVVRYLKIDTSAPTVTVTGAGLASTTGTTTWQAGNRTVTFSMSDAPAGIASQSAKYTWDASAFPTTSATDFTSGDEFTADGYYRFEVIATDNAGNNTTVVRYLKIDASDPVVTATGTGLAETTGEATWQDGSRAVNYSVSDSTSGIASQTTKYTWDTSGFPATSNTTFFTNPLSVSNNGYYRVEVSATDNAGNTTTVVRYLKIDMAAPDVTVTGTGLASTAGASTWQKVSRTVTYSVSDPMAGVASQSAKYTRAASAFPITSTTIFTNGDSFSDDGYYRFEVSATDNAGNIATSLHYLKIDTSAPTVTVTGTGLAEIAGEATWQNGSRTITFSVSDSPAGIASQTAKYTRAAGAFPTTSATAFTSGTVFSTDGYYRFEVSATDNAGNSTTVVRYLKIDATAPTVTVTGTGLATTEGTTAWQDGSRSVTYSVSDSLTGIASQSAKYSWAEDAFPTTSDIIFTSGDAFSTDGYYRFEVSATDNAGNTTTIVRYLKIDTSAPMVTVSGTGLAATEGAATWQDSSRVITYTVNDPTAGIASQLAKYTRAADAFPTTSDTTFTSGDEFTDDGYYRFEVSATDSAGNSTTVVRYLKIDTSDPVVTVTGTGLAATEGAASWQDGSRTATFSVSDSPAGIASQTARYSWATSAFPLTATTTFTSGDAFATSGYYRFEVNATDNAGNSAPVTRYLKIDTAGPQVTITGVGLANTEGTTSWQDGSRTITFSASDSLAGIDSQAAKYSWAASAFPTASATDFTSGDAFADDGYYRFEVNATDSIGNSTTGVRYLKIDATAPNLATLSQLPVSWTNGSVDVTATGQGDNLYGAGVENVYCRLEGYPTQATYDSKGAGSCSGALTANGRMYWRVYDDAGNYSEGFYQVTTIDATKPTVNLSGTGLEDDWASTAWQDSSTVTYSFSDGDSGIATEQSSGKYAFSATDEVSTDAACSEGTAFSSPRVFNTSGYYAFCIHATDEAGNSDEKKAVMKLDNSAPSNPIVSDAHSVNNTWQATFSTPAFSWTAPGDISAIDHYRYCWSTAIDCVPETEIPGVTIALDALTTSGGTSGVYYLRMDTTDGNNNTSGATTVYTFKYILSTDDANKPETVDPANVVEDSGIPEEWQNDYPDVKLGWTGPVDPDANSKPAIAGWNYKWQRGVNDCLVSPTVLNSGYLVAGKPENTGGYDPAAAVVSGDYCLLLQTVDAAGLLSDWQVVRHLRYDNVAPGNPTATVDVNGATSGAWGDWNDPSFLMSGSTDTNSGVTGYYYCWDTDSLCTPSTFTGGNTFNPPAVSSDGTYYLRLKTVDNAGNESSVGTGFVYRSDTNGPQSPGVATEGHGAENAVWQRDEDSPSFTWAASDDGTGSGTNGYEVCWSTSPTCGSGTYSTSRSFVPEPQSEGIYYLRVRPRDSAGNYGLWSTIFNWRYDASSPSNPTVAETHGYSTDTWQRLGGQYNFTWAGASDATGSGIAGYNVCWSDSSSGCTSEVVTRTAMAFMPETMVAGTKYLRLRTYDNVGNYAAWVSPAYIAKYDNIPPSNITNISETAGSTPANTWQRTNNTPTFLWSGASDAMSGLDHYQYKWAQGAIQTTTATTYSPGSVTTGVYTISVRATDKSGNVAASWRDFVFKYDNTLPTLPVTVLETHGAVNGVWQSVVNTPSFTWTAPTDVGSGINSYWICWGANDCTPDVSVTNPAFTAPQVTASGAYYLRMYARDNAGNNSLPQTKFVFRMDNDPPNNVTVVTETHGIASNTWSSVAQRSFVWQPASDPTSSVASYDIYYGTNANGNTAQVTVTEAAWDAPEKTAGTYYLRIRPKDAAGNIGSWATGYISRIDDTAPSNPADGSATDGLGSTNAVWQSANNRAQLTLVASTDGLGDISDYDYCWSADPECVPSVNMTGTITTPVLTVSGMEARPYYLRVKARDAALNTSDVYTAYTFLFDGQPPAAVTSATSSSANSSEWTNTRDNPITFNWDDPGDYLGSGVAGYYYYNGPSSVGTSSNFVASESVSIPTPTQTGVQYLRLRTVDHAGNQSCWSTAFSLYYDITPPTNLNILAPAVSAAANYWIEWSATDAHSGMQYYVIEVSDDGGDWTTWRNTVVGGDTFFGEMGHTYQFRMKAVDRAGNESEYLVSNSVQVLGDTTQPTPEATATPTSTPTATATATPTATPANSAEATVQAQSSNATATAQSALATTQAGQPTSTPTATATPNRDTGDVDIANIVLNADKSTVKPGEQIQFTLDVTNIGSADAIGTSAYVGTPQYTSLSDWTGWQKSGELVYWIGDIPAGETVSLTYGVQVDSDVPAGVNIVSVASVHYRYVYPSNQVGSGVGGQAVFTESSFAVDKAQARRGETLRYTLQVRNTGNVAETVTTSITNCTSALAEDMPMPASISVPAWGLETVTSDYIIQNEWNGDVIKMAGEIQSTSGTITRDAETTVVGPDLRPSFITQNLDEVKVGEQVHYSVVLRNEGADAANTTVLLPVPDHTLLVEDSLTNGAWWDNLSSRIVWQGTVSASGGEVTIGFDVVANSEGIANAAVGITYNAYYEQEMVSDDLQIGANSPSSEKVFLPILLK